MLIPSYMNGQPTLTTLALLPVATVFVISFVTILVIGHVYHVTVMFQWRSGSLRLLRIASHMLVHGNQVTSRVGYMTFVCL